MTRSYGWRRDHLDHRDYRIERPATAPLPPRVDLSPTCPPVYDQGDLGSCTGNALAGAFDFERGRQKLSFMNPSRLFIYYNERAAEGTVGQDAGAELRDGIKSIVKFGVCPESQWPYDVARFTDRPSDACYAEALHNQAVKYGRLTQSEVALRSNLAAGYAFAFGFSVYQSFEAEEVARTGIVPLPLPHEAPLGGHAVVAVGYDNDRQLYKVRNSWGAGWGDGGYFWLPYAYLHDPDLASDFWAIELVEDGE